MLINIPPWWCRCSHLTNFGLLFDMNGVLDGWSPTQMAILSYLSIVLCSLSIIASVVTVLILQLSRWDVSVIPLINSYLSSRLPSSPRIQIVKNRALSMAALYVLFLVGFDRKIFLAY